MIVQLQNITDIRFGVSVKTSNRGSVICFQIKNIGDNGNLDLNSLLYIDESNVDEADVLRPGDLLLPAKGAKFNAVAISEKPAFLAVASSSLFVVRITEDDVDPLYVQWFLNLPRTQWNLEKEATGTNISSLSIKYLRKFPVTIPDLATQKKIIRLKQLQKRESEIMNNLDDKRKSLVEAVTKKLIT